MPTHQIIYASPTWTFAAHPLDLTYTHLCPTYWNVHFMEFLYLVNVAKYNFFLALQGSGEEVVNKPRTKPLQKETKQTDKNNSYSY